MDKNNTKPTKENATPTTAKKSRSSKKDRSAGKYSEADFRNMPRDQQFDLAKKYMNISSETFDKSGLFKFSSTHFNKICSELGFKKELIPDAHYFSSNLTQYHFRPSIKSRISSAILSDSN